MNTFLKWWLLIVLISAGLAAALYFEAAQFLLQYDLTKLSFIIITLFILSTTVIGFKIYSSDVKKNEPALYETEWFVSESMISLGMIGTLVGFIIMLFSVFGSLSIANTAAIEMALSEMAQGMATAMLTTLVGLICSLAIKCQLIVAES